MAEESFFSRMDGDGKKSEMVTVRLSDTRKQFIEARLRQEGMESPSDYMRKLVEQDYLKAASDFRLLAEALGVKVNNGINGSDGYVS